MNPTRRGFPWGKICVCGEGAKYEFHDVSKISKGGSVYARMASPYHAFKAADDEFIERKRSKLYGEGITLGDIGNNLRAVFAYIEHLEGRIDAQAQV